MFFEAMKKCCFFGHAEYRYEDYREAIKAAIIALIENEGVTAFYSGGRGDFDNLCAHIVGDLSKDYPDIENIKFLSYIPTGDKLNNYLAPYYTGTEYLLEESVIPKFAITKTNQKAVELCDFVISGVCRSYGGAYQAVRYARHKQKVVIDICKNT